MKPTVKHTAGIAALLSILMAYEGVRNFAYQDAVGVPTICWGHTQGVNPGDHKSDAECFDLLDKDARRYYDATGSLIKVPVSPKTQAAFASFSYNVGLTAFRRSTALKKLNSRDYKGACNELLRWTRAGNKVLPGLVKRREAERQLCLDGLRD